ncbi:MAG: N(4)-(beta-N-acetylglucosaminyl)-L-asparaginase [Saprospiraceae bacterium]|nr:N(4)-(beta-N-acetylglucosaminyl)-L-asparaginase [Saprospiraceae bacterium]
MQRRKFIKHTGIGFATLGIFRDLAKLKSISEKDRGAITIATWNNKKAVMAAWEVLSANGSALDAVEAGARIPEEDPLDTSVGYGGYPDREGRVSLDASIMDHEGNAGSVFFLQGILHPISVAKLVMQKTPHVYLAGEGAKLFALENGFEEQNLLTPAAEKAYLEWKKINKYSPKIGPEQHDTIGILAKDRSGRLSGACTTSGLAFKMHGRVGDSPIIGSGLFVDNKIGAASATGLGEAVIKKVGSFSIVEMMRNKMNPEKACKKAIERLLDIKGSSEFQVGYIAMNKAGETGAYSLRAGFPYVVVREGKFELLESKSFFDKK